MKCFICGGEINSLTLTTVREGNLVHLFIQKCRRVNQDLREELERLIADHAAIAKSNEPKP